MFIVFVGGPGQGKSTLTQFFCQTHRVALLEQSSPVSEVIRICRNVKEECETENLSLPAMPRFPIRIELNQFATALANQEVDSIFNYVLQRITLRSNYDLNSEDLRKWLEYYPWLVALDGLDEVPSSSNREQVLDAVQDFLIDAHECNADLMVVSTTRPQGYNDDFSPSEYQHFQLAHLDTQQALHYSKRLIQQKWFEDEDKIQRLLGRMERASTESATARLMRSPLQVTIMALLVESLGEPPKERWKLFSEYYRVINTREKERDIPAARLLASFQTDIDTIHQRAGLKLQATSEKSGGTDALLSIGEFDEIVSTRLDEEGHTGDDADDLKRNIINAAMERLVFLVAPKQDKIGFEIRSLQEYMAAECLMNTSDKKKLVNMRAIIFASHWRNVFLFAAGKCFHKEQHLRAEIAQLCNELNEGDISSNHKDGNLEKLTLSGSLLALDILEDGAIDNQPGFMKTFLRLALKLLEIPSSDNAKRLAELYKPKYSDIYKEEIEKHLSKSCKEMKLVAWQLLTQLRAFKDKWINEFFTRKWPDNKQEAMEILQFSILAKEAVITPWISGVWANTVLFSPVPAFNNSVRFFNARKVQDDLYQKAPEGLVTLLGKDEKKRFYEKTYKVRNIPDCFSIRLYEVQEEIQKTSSRLSIPSDSHPTWHWLIEALSFWSDASKDILHHLIESFIKINNKTPMNDNDLLSWPIPWPVKSLAFDITKNTDPGRPGIILDAITNGELGGKYDWLKAQKRWEDNGLLTNDLLYYSSTNLPFDKHIGEIGFPMSVAGASVSHSSSSPEVLNRFYELWMQSKNTPMEQYIKSNLIFLLSVNASFEKHEIDSDIIMNLTEILDKDRHRNWIRLNILDVIPEKDYKQIDIDEVLRLIADFDFTLNHEVSFSICEYIESQIIKFPNAPHFLKLLITYTIAGYKIKSPTLVSILKESNDLNISLINLSFINDNIGIKKDISSELLKLHSSSDDAVKNALSVIKKHKLNGGDLEIFLCELYEGIAIEKWENRQKVLEELREHQQKHLSYAEDIILK